MPEEFSWMRIKGNHANGQATRCTGRTCIFNDLLMTAMDTIKIANRRNHVTMRQRGVTNRPGQDLAGMWIGLIHGAALYRATRGNINDVNALFHPSMLHLWHNARTRTDLPAGCRKKAAPQMPKMGRIRDENGAHGQQPGR